MRFAPNTLMMLGVLALGLSAIPALRSVALASNHPSLRALEPICLSMNATAKRSSLGYRENFYAAFAEACRAAMYISVHKGHVAAVQARQYLTHLEEYQEILSALSSGRTRGSHTRQSKALDISDTSAFLIAHESGLINAYSSFLAAEQMHDQ